MEFQVGNNSSASLKQVVYETETWNSYFTIWITQLNGSLNLIPYQMEPRSHYDHNKWNKPHVSEFSKLVFQPLLKPKFRYRHTQTHPKWSFFFTKGHLLSKQIKFSLKNYLNKHICNVVKCSLFNIVTIINACPSLKSTYIVLYFKNRKTDIKPITIRTTTSKAVHINYWSDTSRGKYFHLIITNPSLFYTTHYSCLLSSL